MTYLEGLKWQLVRLPAALDARIDTWARIHGRARSEAIQYLLEFALEQESAAVGASRDRRVERRAESQIDRLIDPDTPMEERERRIHRLTEGPPEFVDLRLDLPRNKKN